MEGVEDVKDVFTELLKTHVDDLRSGNLPKGKFIGKYMQEIRNYEWGDDIPHDEVLKKPQVINDGDDSTNTWLDYIINMDEEEFLEFRKRLFDEIE